MDAFLQSAGLKEIEEERARQVLAVAADADPQKEAARIRERHTRDLVSGLLILLSMKGNSLSRVWPEIPQLLEILYIEFTIYYILYDRVGRGKRMSHRVK